MKTKHVLSLLVAFILSAGIALAQQRPAEPPPPPNPDDDTLENSFTFFADGSGFLGVYAEDINKDNMARYHLNQVRGVGITRIVKESPAEKAGLRKDDVILRMDGENVTSVRKLNRLVSEIAPDQSVRVTISRSGAEQELTATMGRRKENDFRGLLRENRGNWEWEGPAITNDGPWVFALGGSRRIGISTTELTKQLSDYFGVTGGHGVLVTNVSEDGPAAKAGLKAGDVITAVDGEAVDASGDISRIINRKKEGEVTVTIIRNKSQQTLRVMPTEGGRPGGLIGRPQIGRRIVIPRVELGTIPEINIAMPRVELGTIPEINIAMPRIELPTLPSMDIRLPRVKVPRVRVIRTTNGPI